MVQRPGSGVPVKVDKATGLIGGVSFVVSPNCDERPPDTPVDLVIVHGISLPPGEFGGSWVEALFTNQLDANAHPYFETLAGLRVSSHLFIRRDGDVVQFVPLHKRAWHAGRSSFQGRDACNDFSIGIELEGTDHQPYTSRQYRVLADLIGLIRQAFPAVTPERVVGHSDVAPGRKTDPGPSFDWKYLFDLLHHGHQEH